MTVRPGEATRVAADSPAAAARVVAPNPKAAAHRLDPLVPRENGPMVESDRCLAAARYEMHRGWLHDAAYCLDAYERDELLSAIALCLGVPR